MQMPTRSAAAPRRTVASEDCLYVNVWMPDHRSGKLPVMVWIHGGGWVQGGTSPISTTVPLLLVTELCLSA
jgi:para-nitrobenzyl esterase